MRTMRMRDGSFTMSCTVGELTLIDEGLFAIERADHALMGSPNLDEADRIQLTEELERLRAMRLEINVAKSRQPSLCEIK